MPRAARFVCPRHLENGLAGIAHIAIAPNWQWLVVGVWCHLPQDPVFYFLSLGVEHAAGARRDMTARTTNVQEVRVHLDGPVLCKHAHSAYHHKGGKQDRQEGPGVSAGGLDQFPYSRKMVVVMFGNKIQMVYELHRRVQTRVGNSSGKQ